MYSQLSPRLSIHQMVSSLILETLAWVINKNQVRVRLLASNQVLLTLHRFQENCAQRKWLQARLLASRQKLLILSLFQARLLLRH